MSNIKLLKTTKEKMESIVKLLVVCVLMFLVAGSHQETIYSKSYVSTYKTETGFYNLNYDGSCEMSLGHIPSDDIWALWSQPYYSPNFTLIASTTKYTGQAFVKVDSATNGKYIMAFNNNTKTCTGSISASKEAYNVRKNTASLTIKYNGGVSINHQGVVFIGGIKSGFRVTSKNSETITVLYSIDDGKSFRTEAIKPSGSSNIQGDEMHLKCDYRNDCIVDVSLIIISGAQRNIANILIMLIPFVIYAIK